MNCSAAPISLHVGLKYICRVHGLTPHRSTGRCPYELHREGPGASLFLLLTSSSKHGCSRSSEQTAVSHSVGRLTRKPTFAEGEEVIVYDLKSKLSSTGRIVEVLGNNTYLADCGNGPQHISGDVLSRVSDVSRRQIGEADIPVRHEAEADDGGQDDVLMDQDDVISNCSDSSDEQDVIQEDVIPNVPVTRRGRRPRCNDDLGSVCEQHLHIRR